ncbi:hypothetical protein H5399_05015 [Tessaracoccus sp. MC1627]|uniref:hypothetical protein n=1 Tax=Tessaracoccus sp. MC1627 TaxID=2760312 RepID=UPI0016042907|nr:hypothetical protein [Tessaracoccus sp. MC1627]MBB1511964.1 hypothetical protein [Tessaracoccus sp. MC1627]
MSDMLSKLQAGMDRLAATVALVTKPQRPVPWGEWAIVDTVTPLMVVLESDETETPRSVSGNAAGVLVADQRVYLLHQGTATTIIGKA